MLRTVFVLGAGASADAGIPLMNDFLDHAEDFNNSNLFDEKNKADYETVSKAVHDLKGVSFNTSLDLNNVETVFSAIDMGRLIGRFGNLNSPEIDDLYSAIVRLIGATIDNSTCVQHKGQRTKLKGTYHRFINLLIQKFRNGNDWLASVITFNYDIALEYALHYENIYPNYHLPNQYEASPLSLLKLHGSVNWSQTVDRSLISPFNLGWYLSAVGYKGSGSQSRLLVSKNVGASRGDNKKYIDKPVIIPPSWNKSEYYESIRPIWHKAAEVLGNAQAIYVIGYSLPETDLFFKYLFALGTHTRTSIRRLWVFDPDPGVNSRFEDMLAPGIRDGHRYRYHQVMFSDAVRLLHEDLNTN